MSRVIRSRDRWARILVGLPDQPSRDIARTMAVAGSTVSPMSRGLHWENTGLTGTGVLENTSLLPYALQQFRGANSPIVHPAVVQGDLLEGSAPSSKSIADLGSVAWMDLGKVSGTRWS